MSSHPLAKKNEQLIQEQPQHFKNPMQQQGHHHSQKLQQKQSKTEADVALAVGRAPWWIPILPATPRANGNKNSIDDDFGNDTSKATKLNFTFAEALKDFLQNFSFHCYGKLVEPGRRYQEKLFWFIFHVASLSTLIMVLLNYNENGERLLTTSIYDPAYPISKVPFPAISVCSINRISNTSATSYAEELNQKDPNKRGVNYYYERIKLLYYIYNTRSEIPNYENALDFQRFLDAYDRDDSEQFYNTRRKMAMLTPNCSNILLKCRLAGEEFDCSRDFRETFTNKGLCCTFNYNRKYAKQRNFRQRFFGQDMGLILLLNATHKDDLFESSNLDGFSVTIHSSIIFPDQSSGSVEERFVKNGTDTFISITPRIFQTVEEARYLRPKVRNCLFRDEMPALFGKTYTFSNCITHCRHRSILVLCQCLLFSVPHDIVPVMNDTEYCSLQHRECLNRYDLFKYEALILNPPYHCFISHLVKWFNVVTQRQNIRGLEREMEDALYCPDCLPTCSEIRHRGAVMSLPLNKYNMKLFESFQQEITDLAIVRVYFGETHAQFYRRFLLNSWFEIFSYVGNICSIIAGFSLIGICEVIFFLAQQLYTAIRNDGLVENINENEAKPKLTLIIFP